jgi:predicted NAD-dependent protein-ADP-ribosyltransferase YbiA (DUF1768 family)
MEPEEASNSSQPLNVASVSSEPVGRLMSNFAPTPIVLDGKRYACVEAFYVCLKFSDDSRTQASIRRMDGREAKRFGADAKVTLAKYQGREFVLGSDEHHALIKRAIRAKLEQNPELARLFASTHPRPIIHDTGHEEKRNTALPAASFTRILTELRDELVGA